MSWERFWFKPESTQTWCLFRVFWGLAICLSLTGFYGLYRIPYRTPNMRPLGEVRIPATTPRSYILDSYNLPTPGFEWLPVPSYKVYCYIEDATLGLAVLFTLGVATRFVSVLLLLSYVYRFCLSQFLYRHYVWCHLLVLVVMALSECSEYYSVDAWLRRHRPPPPERAPVPRRLLQIMVSIIYLGASTSKLTAYWLSGGVLKYLAWPLRYMVGPLGGQSGPVVSNANWLAGCDVVAETWMVFGLWIPEVRAIAFFMGVMLHLGIDATMSVRTFSYEIITMYMLFLNPACHQVQVHVRPGLAHLGRALDWFARVEWIGTPETALSVQVGDAAYDGLEGWVQVLLRLPLTFPLAAWPAVFFSLRRRYLSA